MEIFKLIVECCSRPRRDEENVDYVVSTLTVWMLLYVRVLQSRQFVSRLSAMSCWHMCYRGRQHELSPLQGRWRMSWRLLVTAQV